MCVTAPEHYFPELFYLAAPTNNAVYCSNSDSLSELHCDKHIVLEIKTKLNLLFIVGGNFFKVLASYDSLREIFN